MINLRIEEIEDRAARENFQRIEEVFKTLALLKGEWRFIEIEVNKAETNLTIPHRLKFKPTDVIQTSITGSGTLTWNYARFDRTNIDITTTDACVVRAFIGSYREE